MKPEVSSLQHQKVAKAAVSKLNEECSLQSALQKVLMQATKRDVSRQESYLMLSKDHDYVTFSSKIRLCSLTGGKVLQLDKKVDDAKVTTDDGWQFKYWKRSEDPKFKEAIEAYENDPEGWKKKCHPNYDEPHHPKDVSLHEYMAFFKKDWTLDKSEHIPAFTPHFSYVPRASVKEKYEDYCRARLLQFKPGSNPENLLSEFETYSQVMDDFIKTSTFCPNLVKEEVEEAHSHSHDEDEMGNEDEKEDNPYSGFPDLLPEMEGKVIKT